MTRLIAIKSGVALNEHRSLVEQLQASVDFNDEVARQKAAMRIRRESGPLPNDDQLEQVQADLSVLVESARWVPV